MSGRTRQLQEAQRRRRARMVLGTVVGAVLVVVVLLVVLTAGDSPDATSDGDVSVISMTEMAFSPDPIDVRLADAHLRIVNDGAVAHSFVVPELGKGTPDLDPGAEMAMDLTKVAPGTYTVICDIPGHREAGMETTITLR